MFVLKWCRMTSHLSHVWGKECISKTAGEKHREKEVEGVWGEGSASHGHRRGWQKPDHLLLPGVHHLGICHCLKWQPTRLVAAPWAMAGNDNQESRVCPLPCPVFEWIIRLPSTIRKTDTTSKCPLYRLWSCSPEKLGNLSKTCSLCKWQSLEWTQGWQTGRAPSWKDSIKKGPSWAKTQGHEDKVRITGVELHARSSFGFPLFQVSTFYLKKKSLYIEHLCAH